MGVWKLVSKGRSRELFVLASLIVYGTVYSILGVMRFYSFNAYVYDLGLSSGLLYGAVHGGTLYFLQNPSQITFNKMIYLPLAILFQSYPNFVPLIIFQAFWVAFGSYALYRISLHVLGDTVLSIVPSLLYLLYFPISGAVWYDFHFQTLFPTFFFIGFWLYLSDRRLFSVLFMFLAAITNYLAAAVVFIFGLLVIYNDMSTTRKVKNRSYVIGLLLFPVIIVALVNMHYGMSYTTSVSNIFGFPGTLLINIWYKFIFVFSILAALLMFSFYSPKYLLLSLPYLIFMFFQGSHTPYYTPFGYQYAALYTPGIFISLVYGISRYKARSVRRKTISSFKRSVGILVAVNIALALVLTPVGNEITGSSFPYDTRQNTTYTAQDQALSSMMAMIPPGSSVLVQGNMPQLTVGYHWIVGYEFNGSNYPKYAINDPYNYLFNDTANIYLYNSSMEVKVFNDLLDSGMYGVLSEKYGIMLIELNYSGYTDFEPLQQTVNNVQVKSSASGVFTLNWSSDFVAPGSYNVTVKLPDSAVTNITFSVVGQNGTVTGYPMITWENASGKFSSCMYSNGQSYSLNPNFSIRWISASGKENVSVALSQVFPLR
ncbi:MAG: DUF2079 domain-containing protein [Thermoplasmataceae archaeon]